MTWWAGALGALAVVLAVGACGSGDTPPSASRPRVELTATATRSSLFDSQRTFRLELTNAGDEDVTVTAVQLVSPLFAPVPASPRDTRLAPAQRLLVPVPFGESVCPAAGSSELVVRVAGTETPLALAQDPDGVMEALHDVECQEAAVRAAADLTLVALVPTGPRSVAGDLVVTGRGDREVAVDSVRGNIVFGVRVADGPDLVRVTAEGEVGRVPVELVVDRCDTHALIESKRTFTFPLAVRLDGSPPARVVLEAQGRTRDILQGLIQACIG